MIATGEEDFKVFKKILGFTGTKLWYNKIDCILH